MSVLDVSTSVRAGDVARGVGRLFSGVKSVRSVSVEWRGSWYVVLLDMMMEVLGSVVVVM